MADQEPGPSPIEASAEEIAEAVIRLKAEQKTHRRIAELELQVQALQELVLEWTLGPHDQDPAARRAGMVRLAAMTATPAAFRWQVYRPGPENPEPAGEAAPCATAHPHCASACCRLVDVPLTPAEARVFDWDPARPFLLRRREDGACIHLDEAGRCAVFAERPSFCRRYSCMQDRKVWEWIDRNRP